MEALLSLTSRRAGEWFKEELRQLGGLEHIVQTVNDCSKVIDFKVEWSPPMLDKLRKVDRCLRVLENVSFRQLVKLVISYYRQISQFSYLHNVLFLQRLLIFSEKLRNY